MEEFRSQLKTIWAKMKLQAISMLQQLHQQKKLHPKIVEFLEKQLPGLLVSTHSANLAQNANGTERPAHLENPANPKENETGEMKVEDRGPTVVITNLMRGDALHQLKEKASGIFQQFFAPKKNRPPVAWSQRIIRYGIAGGIFYVALDTGMDFLFPPAQQPAPTPVAQTAQPEQLAAEETPVVEENSQTGPSTEPTEVPEIVEVAEEAKTSTAPANEIATSKTVPVETPFAAETPVVVDAPQIGENIQEDGVPSEPVTKIETGGEGNPSASPGPTAGPLAEHQKAVEKVNENIAPLVSEVQKLPNQPPPNYEIVGRGLVYNCAGRHWACVDKSEYLQCKRNMEWASAKGQERKSQCMIVNVYASNDDCRVVQLYNINMMVASPQCRGEEQKNSN